MCFEVDPQKKYEVSFLKGEAWEITSQSFGPAEGNLIEIDLGLEPETGRAVVGGQIHIKGMLCFLLKVMLISLSAGGVGLNLIGGNHLFLLDMHW